MNCPADKVAKYKAIFKPKCNGGGGCDVCWIKYWYNKKRRR